MSVVVDGTGWPALPSEWRKVELEYDPRRRPGNVGVGGTRGILPKVLGPNVFCNTGDVNPAPADRPFTGQIGPLLVLDRALTEEERGDLASGRVTMEEFAKKHGMELR